MSIQVCTIKIKIIFRMNSKFLSIPATLIVLIGVVLIFEFIPIDSFMQSWLYDDKSQTWMADRNNPVLDLLFSTIDSLKIFKSRDLALKFIFLFIKESFLLL